MNCERLLVFLRQLIKDRERKTFLILDNLRVHHGKLIKAWEEENIEAIELFFLPPYSPDKNPDEYLNCDLKRGLSDRPSPKDGDRHVAGKCKGPYADAAKGTRKGKKIFHASRHKICHMKSQTIKVGLIAVIIPQKQILLKVFNMI